MPPSVSGAGVEQCPVTAKLHVGGLLCGASEGRKLEWELGRGQGDGSGEEG